MLADYACQRGYRVTLFNRGMLPKQPSDIILIKGDRTNAHDLTDLSAAGPWDAVVDVWGVIPAIAWDAARALRNATNLYVFISSVSAYRDWPEESVDEGSALYDADPDFNPGEWEWDERLYGSMKAGCELAIAREFASSQRLVLRPTIILGPHEYSARLTWWLGRMSRGGRVLAPGKAGRSIQPVDVRDLANFTLDLIEQEIHGVYNVAAPPRRDYFGGLLDACNEVVSNRCEITWVDEMWLAAQGVRQWTELPLWRVAAGTWAVDHSSAQAAGLVCRRLRETVADTWSWMSAGGVPVPHVRQSWHGIDPAKEERLLHGWNSLRSRAL